MAVFAFLLHFYTVMVIKKTKFSTESTKIRHFDLKIWKKILLGRGHCFRPKSLSLCVGSYMTEK